MKAEKYKSLIKKAYIKNIYTDEYDLKILGITKLEKFIIKSISESRLILQIISSIDGFSLIHVNELICVELKCLNNSDFYEYTIYPNADNLYDELKNRVLDADNQRLNLISSKDFAEHKKVKDFTSYMKKIGINEKYLLEAADDLAFLNMFSVSFLNLKSKEADKSIGIYIGKTKCWKLEIYNKNCNFINCNKKVFIDIIEKDIISVVRNIYYYNEAGEII